MNRSLGHRPPSGALSIVIAGLRKSGTTALFHKLKSAMPQDTICLFEPREFDAVTNGDASHVLAKILLPATNAASFDGFNKKILIVRDPRDRIVSQTLYDVYDFPDFCADKFRVAEYIRNLREKEADPKSISMLDLIGLCSRLTGRDGLSTKRAASRAALPLHAPGPQNP